jgi:phosphoglycolate phosphatase
VFDLDGTLLDTLADIAACTNRWLAAGGFPTHRIDAYRGMIGKGAPFLISQALPPAQRSAAQIRAGVAAYQRDYAVHGTAHTRPFAGIPALLGALPDVPVKPDPAMPRRMTELLGVPAAAIAYLGDTEVDMHTARGSGMFAIGVTWGVHTRQELTAAGAEAVIDRPAEALALIA